MRAPLLAGAARDVERTVLKGVAPTRDVAIVLSGSFEYDNAQVLALRTVTLPLQSRLLDTIRQELGDTYGITAAPDVEKFPRARYTVRVEWTCDPARTKALVQRVFDEIAFVRDLRLSPNQMALVRAGLLREYESNSQDNAYLLREISRRYAEGDADRVEAVDRMPERVAALTADTIHQAAQIYLDTTSYVMVTLAPEPK